MKAITMQSMSAVSFATYLISIFFRKRLCTGSRTLSSIRIIAQKVLTMVFTATTIRIDYETLIAMLVHCFPLFSGFNSPDASSANLLAATWERRVLNLYG